MTTSVVATAFGGPEVLRVVDTEPGDPSTGQVLVELRAIGVNPIDYKVYSGEFGTDESTLPRPLGVEAAGVVVAVGGPVVGPAGPIAVGDEVIICGASGLYAEKAVVPAETVLPKPPELDWNLAAGTLLVAGTAYDTLEVAAVEEGDTVLVHGAAGGVGSVVVQLAKARGATVIGTARSVNHEYLRELGVQPVEYGDGLVERIAALAPNGITAAIDTVGSNEAVDVSLELLADKARLVTTVAFGRAAEDGFAAVNGGSPESAARRRNARLPLLAQAAAGDYVVTVAKTFPLSEAATAHEELKSRHPRGKFILIP